uniref:Uncharacterized protein n=1 Tax=Buteo japonicus TaxID=224669 RepID=A0A8C0BXR2_9AVES
MSASSHDSGVERKETISLNTLYQLQQEAPRPKRIICPREVSSSFALPC